MQYTIQDKMLRFKTIVAFAVIYFIWGSTFMGIRIAIETIPPFLMAGIRFTVAGIMLFSWCSWKHEGKPELADWKHAAVSGVTMIFVGYGSLSWAQQFVPSGFAALIDATVPIWMIVLAWALSRDFSLDGLTLAGISLGLVGVALLSGVRQEILIDSSRGVSVFFSAAVITLGAISWSAGSIYSRKLRLTVSLKYTIGMQMLVGGLALLLIGSLAGQWHQMSLKEPSLRSVIALGYLILFGTLIAYSAYIWLLHVSTPAKVGTYAFFNPLVAILLGWVLMDEPLTAQMFIGASFILISILFINQPKLMKKQAELVHQPTSPSNPKKKKMEDFI